MSDERTLNGPGSIADLRRVASLDGSDLTEGKPYLDLPKWFTRLGRNRFSIDSGFGTVQMKVVPLDDALITGFMRQEPNACKKMLQAIVALPAWAAEDRVALDKDLVIEVGEPLPSVETVAAKSPAVCAKFVGECLPASLLQQIVAGLRFMLLPPIAFTPAQSD